MFLKNILEELLVAVTVDITYLNSFSFYIEDLNYSQELTRKKISVQETFSGLTGQECLAPAGTNLGLTCKTLPPRTPHHHISHHMNNFAVSVYFLSYHNYK